MTIKEVQIPTKDIPNSTFKSSKSYKIPLKNASEQNLSSLYIQHNNPMFFAL